MARLTRDDIFSIAQQYATKKAFKANNKGAYEKACRDGIIDEVTAHMLVLKRSFNIETLHNIANGYATKAEFIRNDKSAYEHARVAGVLDTICSHMVPSKVFWTGSSITTVAAAYTSRSEFKQKDYNAYRAAIKLGVLSAVCSHMPYSNAFDLSAPAILYYFKIDNVFKIGVTNRDVETRYYQRDVCRMTNLQTWDFDTGKEAIAWERYIIKAYNKFEYTGNTPFTDGTGTTECFTKDILGGQ